MADSTPKSYHTDPTLYLYTSLTSGSSHIISATSRMQTILKANRIEFQALDVATDEKARMLWGRRAGKRKLPGLVRFGMIVGDLEEVEEWNEYGELKDNVNLPSPAKAAPATPTASTSNTPSKAPVPQAPPQSSATVDNGADAVATSPAIDARSDSVSTVKSASTTPSAASTLSMAMRQAGFEAAKKAGEAKTKARHDELERLKAKSADLQNLNNSGPSGMPPPSSTAEAEEAKKLENRAATVASTADKVQLTKDGEIEEAAPNNIAAKSKSADEEAVQTEMKANKEMAKAAHEASTGAAEPGVLEGNGQTEEAANMEMANATNEASTGAAEPDVLERKGQVEPEETATKSEPLSISAMKEPEEPAAIAEPPHILNAKEAEEEANKAIIADEATHVHIAGSPPPHASPGMKYPRDEPQDPVPPSTALKDGVENEEKGKMMEEEDLAGKVDSAKTTVKDEDATKTEGAAPIEPEGKVEDVTRASIEQNKTGTDTEEPTVEDIKAEPKATEESFTEDRSKTAEEAAPKSEISEDDNSKHEGPTEGTKHTETEEPSATDEKQDLPGTKLQEQPAASGEKAGESVSD